MRAFGTHRSRCAAGAVLLLVWLGVFASAGVAEATQDSSRAPRVAIVRPPRKSFDAAVATMQRDLAARGRVVSVITLPPTKDSKGAESAWEKLRAFKPDVIATGGEQTTRRVLETIPKTPLVFFLVVNAGSAAFMQPESSQIERVCGVTSDPPPRQQIDCIAAVDPACRKLGILHGERLTAALALFTKAAERTGISIVSIVASRNDFPQAVARLNQSKCDAVLMIPDSDVYNQQTIRRLILWGLRQKKPVWTFSRNIVEAGALGGTFHEQVAVARATIETIEAIIAGKPPKTLGVRYPSLSTKEVNANTAKQIGLKLNRRDLDPTIEWFER